MTTQRKLTDGRLAVWDPRNPDNTVLVGKYAKVLP